MSEVNSQSNRCIFCLRELKTTDNIRNEAHNSCLKVVEQFKSNDSLFLGQLTAFYPDHEFKMYLIPGLTFDKSSKFTYQKIEALEETLEPYRSQFPENSKLIIMILDNTSNSVALDLYNINFVSDTIFTRNNLLYLSITFSEKAGPSEPFELDSMTNLAGLSITSFSKHQFPIFRNRTGNCKVKFLELTYLGQPANTSIPDGIESLLSLEVLDLSFPLQEYPNSLCYLPSLQSLRISSSVTPWNLVIPNTIVNLRNLQDLQLVSTSSTQSHESDVLSSLNTIEVVNKTVERKVLNLESYLVQGFTFGFDELYILFHPKKLLHLFLNLCHIDNPSNEMLMFINLQVLDLGFNRMQEIPPFIQTFKHIEEIALNDNLLTDFSAVLKIRSIRIINLENNNIEDFPDDLVKPRQKRYTKIILRGNKLKSVPDYPFIEL